MYRLLPVLLTLFSQFTVTAESGIVASSLDVAKVNTALSTWIGSFFNLVSDFSGVLIALLIFFVVLNYLKFRH